MKKIVLSIIALMFFTTALFASSQKHSLSLLFVIHAKNGSIIETKNKTYQLQIQNPPSHVAYFSDRPNRVVGKMTIMQFIRAWNFGPNSFKKTPPNAAFVGALDIQKNNHHADSFWILSNPSYSKKTNTLMFDVHSMKKDQEIKVDSFNDIALFIDTFPYNTDAACPSTSGSWC